MQETDRITKLEDKVFRVPWYAKITSGTTGAITPPTGGTIVLGQWPSAGSAKASTVTAAGKPTGIIPQTAGGTEITVTISSNGAWALSGIPSSYPIAIIYYYSVKLFNLDINYLLSTPTSLTGQTLTPGTVTGDIIRYNVASAAWEVKSEPFSFTQINLTPAAAAVLDIEGGMWYKSSDKSVYVCTAVA